MTLRIGIIGLGQIARGRHLSAIAGSPDFTLAGLASLDAPPPLNDMPVHPTHAGLLAAVPDLDAVAICTPPAHRFAVACDALRAGKHVLLEKPPGRGVAEVDALARLAAREGRSLFTAWHSQFNPAVDAARRFLAGRRLATLRVDWNEDFRRYHPDQAWIWQSDGFGVFDMGINALSVLSRLFAIPPFVRAAELRIAANHQAPIAATIDFATIDGTGPMVAHMDWSITGPDQREIRLTTACGHAIDLLDSGGHLAIDGETILAEPRREYPMLYTRFADLIRQGRSDIDTAPLQMTADAYLIAHRVTVGAFEG